MFFKNIISFRLRDEEMDQINKIMLSNRDKYFNLSHFVRCAVIKLINFEIRGEKNVEEKKVL